MLDQGGATPKIVKPPKPPIIPRPPTNPTARIPPMTPGLWQSMLPDVRPEVITDALNRGYRVNYSPGAANPHTVGGQIYYGAGQLGRETLGHETVHAWQDTNRNPFTLLARAGTLAGYLGSQAQGKPYTPNYGGINMEGQASLYYGPPGSTYNNAPEWVRRSALKGFLREPTNRFASDPIGAYPPIPGWGARIRSGR